MTTMTMETTTTDAPVKPSWFETTCCGRCGGSGHYSYCQRYGTTCFGCSGSGKKYTKRGAAAVAFYTSLLSRPVSELQPGMKFRESSVTMDGSVYFAWFTAVSVAPNTTAGHIVNGDTVYDGLTVEATEGKSKRAHTFHGWLPNYMLRIASTAAQKAEAKAKALAYQDTLTKTGTVRKIKGGK